MVLEPRHIKYIAKSIFLYLAIAFIAFIFVVFWIFNDIIGLIVLIAILFFLVLLFSKRYYRKFLPKGWSRIKRYTKPKKIVKHGNNIKIEKKIFNSVNNIRHRHNLSTLEWDDNLYPTAHKRANAIIRNFSHQGCPSGCGENIAMMPIGNIQGIGFVNRENIAQNFVKNWMRSPGHRSNILRTNYHSISIGVAQYGRKYYAVQLFN